MMIATTKYGVIIDELLEVGRLFEIRSSLVTPMKVRITAVAMLAGLLAQIGCGGPSATVKGRVTCQGKPVVGGILFTPKGEDASNTGPAVTAVLKDDGTYETRLTTIGKHTIVVTPRDITYPPKPGEFEYPCDRSPQEHEVKSGDNDITIELTTRTK
jgi:hypothetical protein